MNIQILDQSGTVITQVLGEDNPLAAVARYRGVTWREFSPALPIPEDAVRRRARLVNGLKNDPILFALIKLLAQRFNLTADQVLTALENNID